MVSALPLAVGLSTALVVTGTGWWHRPVPVRRPEPVPGATPVAAGEAPRRDLLGAAGAHLARLARIGPAAAAHRRLGRLAAVGLVAGALQPALGVAFVVAGVTREHLVAARQRREHRRTVAVDLPDVVDLLLLCLGSGLSLPLAHAHLADRLRGPVGVALRTADHQTEGGVPRADALVACLVPLGERAHALGHTLSDHLRYGSPLVPSLERLSLELRLARRQAAEQEARQVPVRLLGPLVTCILPAFGLLTVVPLLVAALDTLPS